MMFLFSSILILVAAVWTGPAYAYDENIYRVQPENARLAIERADLTVGSTPVVLRAFHGRQKERGLFGAGWCSNLDLKLIASDEAAPVRLELRDCQKGQTRIFRKMVEVWVEESSSSRVLRTADGKWQMTDGVHAVFQRDGSLESFVAGDGVRWVVRRDSNANIVGLDNMKEKTIRFRRNAAGDLDSIIDARGRITAKYHFQTMLESVDAQGMTEIYEYDADGNLLKLVRNRIGSPSQLWRFLYTTPEFISSVQEPSGCTVRWVFDRTVDPPAAKGSRACVENRLGMATPVRSNVAPVKSKVKPDEVKATPLPAQDSSISPSKTVTLIRPAPLGVGSEKAVVTVNRQGFPILFEILGPNGQVRRLEITREDISGSALFVRSGAIEVGFQKKSRAYDARQLELLDDYENWMSSWGSR